MLRLQALHQDGLICKHAKQRQDDASSSLERMHIDIGGRHRNRLFMTASASVYSLFVNTHGVAYA